MPPPRAEGDLAAAVAAVPHWYHTLDLGSGVVTPGFFDLRTVVDHLPWPDVDGKRCLDVGTFDGFYAFELERRGAAEVVAIDLDDAVDLDWLPRQRPAQLRRGDEPVGSGFLVAHRALGSRVERVTSSVYDLDPAVHGAFDVVVCGALLQHLRDPFGALLAIHRVCAGSLLSVEHVDTRSSLLHPRTPILRLVGRDRTWSLPNVRGHRQLVHQSGFDLDAATRIGIPWGVAGDPRPSTARGQLQRLAQRVGWRLLVGAPHVPFSAVRASAVR